MPPRASKRPAIVHSWWLPTRLASSGFVDDQLKSVLEPDDQDSGHELGSRIGVSCAVVARMKTTAEKGGGGAIKSSARWYLGLRKTTG